MFLPPAHFVEFANAGEQPLQTRIEMSRQLGYLIGQLVSRAHHSTIILNTCFVIKERSELFV